MDEIGSVIDDSRVAVQLVASYTIVIYDDHVFIVTGHSSCLITFKFRKLFTPLIKI
jgi:hypothetical protein